MATVNRRAASPGLRPALKPPQLGASPPLHRIHEVRRQQGVSLRSAARRLAADMREARRQEEASSDLRLSDLYKWQQVLDVPVEDLLVEPRGALSRPVLDRARLVRLMKTAMALLENSSSTALHHMAENLVEQLIDIMPELAHVGPWHSVGQRRSLDELGRAAERRISDDFLLNLLRD